MTYPARLIVARTSLDDDGLAAICLDTKEQCHVANHTDAYEFMCDCIGLDDHLAQRYTKGQAIAAGMPADDWALWVEAHPDTGSHVWLTCSKESNGGVSALELTTSREAIAPPKEVDYFLLDCLGWDAQRFSGDYSIVVRMTAENWDSWLAMYEVSERLDDDTTALLSAI